MIKLIAFDWNGTLLSDTQITLKAENKALKAINVKPISLKKFQDTFDIPITRYWNNIGFSKEFVKANLDVIENTFHSEYKKYAVRARTRAGVREILNWLKSQNINASIYSNHDIPDIKKQLTRLKIEKFITTILANPGDERLQIFNRHKDQKLNNYRKRQNIKPLEVISIGDTCEEIEIGKEYGYHTVALTSGFNSTARLKAAKPDFLIHNMVELKKIVKQLNKA
jgi:phosphoglycolate phosphatase